ncbi:hypothetical protein DYB34_012535 [Aphanomyces astaci]|uniref:Uncharacterized protein n=1 Tax=Aphanomyces astaci TaxID=112090 RepID=A0A3R6ZD82_APHAT|nr:hypothetical protein DYB34_012535 [Aphanomyces astaci]
MRLLVDVEDKKDDLINSTDPNRHVTASKGPTISVGYEEASKMEADSIDRSVPTEATNTAQVDKIHTPTADGSNVPSIQLERRRPSHPEPPPSPPPYDAVAVHTIPRLPLSRLVVENSAGKSTQTTPSVAKPHANSMQAATAPTTTFAAERQTLLANAQPLSSLEESMMLKPKDPMDQQQQQQPCAARCMSCMKDILVDLPGGDPENDVADAHDLVHNGLTRKVNIGQFASKVPETI